MKSFRVGKAKHGRGLFATRDVAAGEIILISKGGALISYKELLKKRVTDNPLQISPRRYVDWGAPGMLMNHSCEPNCGLLSYPDIAFLSLRSIKKGEQFTWDYSTSIDKDTECDFDCECGSKLCRKRIGGFKWLPKARKNFYIANGVVQKYLLKEK